MLRLDRRAARLGWDGGGDSNALLRLVRRAIRLGGGNGGRRIGLGSEVERGAHGSASAFCSRVQSVELRVDLVLLRQLVVAEAAEAVVLVAIVRRGSRLDESVELDPHVEEAILTNHGDLGTVAKDEARRMLPCFNPIRVKQGRLRKDVLLSPRCVQEGERAVLPHTGEADLAQRDGVVLESARDAADHALHG